MPAGLARVVVAHHPLLPPEGEVLTQVAGNATAALAAFAAHDVRLVLSGHLHRSYARLSAPGAVPGGRAPLVLQGGSATSTRLRGEENAYNRIAFSDGGEMTITGRIWHDGAWRDAPAQIVGLPALPAAEIGAGEAAEFQAR